ncbi:unnamed protein product [Gadus morhua 'NCC']
MIWGGRKTSLFNDQISGGNTSLRLARVNLQDQGRYLCYASTSQYNQETFVTLTVRAVFLIVEVLVQGDTQVGCVFGGSCVLPCRFQPNSDTILHWVKKWDGEEVKVLNLQVSN